MGQGQRVSGWAHLEFCKVRGSIDTWCIAAPTSRRAGRSGWSTLFSANHCKRIDHMKCSSVAERYRPAPPNPPLWAERPSLRPSPLQRHCRWPPTPLAQGVKTAAARSGQNPPRLGPQSWGTKDTDLHCTITPLPKPTPAPDMRSFARAASQEANGATERTTVPLRHAQRSANRS